MKGIVLYDSKSGTTKRVIKRFTIPFDVYHVSENFDLLQYDWAVFFCPTYGDEELPDQMEDFIWNLSVKDKKFTICELGNYYGYDDLQFGARYLLESSLKSLGWVEHGESLSLDSFPKINWPAFEAWVCKIEKLSKES